MGAVTKSIGTAARNYSTLQAWEDALPANLVTDGNSQVGECYNDSEFSVVGTVLTIAGETTDSTHTITLKCAAGQSWRDNASVQTNRFTYNQSNGVGILSTGNYASSVMVSVDYVTFDGLQIKASGDHNLLLAAQVGGHNVFKNCIFYSNPHLKAIDIWRGNKMLNCLLLLNGTAGNAFRFTYGAVIANCTVARTSNNAASGAFGAATYSTTTVINCAIFGFNTSSTGTYATDGHNCTDHTAAPGSTGNLVSKTYANQFVQSSAGGGVEDFRMVGNTADLYNAGATDTTNNPSAVDAAGTSRPQSTSWDIGAWELVVSGGPTYTLTSATGAFALTGNAAGLVASRKLAAAAGSFTLTGIAAALKIARKLAVGTGAYSLTGNATGLARGYTLAAGAGSYALTGADANLTPSSRAAGQSGAGKKKRYVVEKNGKLLVFTNRAMAIAVLDAETSAQEKTQENSALPELEAAPKKEDKESEPKVEQRIAPKAPQAVEKFIPPLDLKSLKIEQVATAAPILEIKLAAMRKQAIAHEQQQEYDRLIQNKRYEALVQLFERMREEEEEDDWLLLAV